MLTTTPTNPEKVIFLGTPVAKYKFPSEYIEPLNNDFDNYLKQKLLPKNNAYLAGKIDGEWNVMHLLNKLVLDFFNSCVQDYINQTLGNFGKQCTSKLQSCWFNDQVENEYNPVHTHSGGSFLGISSVLFLKVPKCIYDAKPKNHNEPATDGRLVFINNDKTFFNKYSELLTPVVGDFYLFPFSLPHLVYPFKGEGVRRSLSFNVDLLPNYNRHGQEKK